jgi:hypothetical protein
VGSVRSEPVGALWRKLVQADLGRDCQRCWVVCRGYSQLLMRGGPWRSTLELLGRT